MAGVAAWQLAALFALFAAGPVLSTQLPVRPKHRTKPHHFRLFCFAWVHISPPSQNASDLNDIVEQDNLKYFVKQMKDCDDYKIFSNSAWENSPITEIDVPTHTWGHNMGNLMACWNYILEKVNTTNFDWFVNVEMDHVMRVKQVQEMIGANLEMAWNGIWSKRRLPHNDTGAKMLEWGNAYLFNKEMVGEMRRQWATLGKTLPTNATSQGCPEWKVGKKDWPLCVQDNDYKLMATGIMQPPVLVYGSPRCNRAICSMTGVEEPKSCERGDMYVPCVSFNRVVPWPDFRQRDTQLWALREISKGNKSMNDLLLRHAAGVEWKTMFDEPQWVPRPDLRYTPIFHRVRDVEVFDYIGKSLPPYGLIRVPP